VSNLAPDFREKNAMSRRAQGLLSGLISVFFIFYFGSLAFAQESQYQPLISGMEQYRDGNFEKALEEFIS